MAGRISCLILASLGVLAGWLLYPKQVSERPQTPLPSLQIVGPSQGGIRQTQGSVTTLRVCLTPAPVRNVELQIEGPFHVRPVGGVQELGRSTELAVSKVQVTSRGFRVGTREYPVTRLELIPDRTPTIWVDGHRYRGKLRLFRRSGGKLIAVNVLPIEEYLASVVDSEMPAAFPDEARKAQAIVARTYALYQMSQSPAEADFDLYAGTRSQKYLGNQYRDQGKRLLAGESDSSRRIVAQTHSMVCTYGGRVFCTYYAAVCGGQTLQGKELFADAVPAVASVPCQWCRDAKYYRWDVNLTREKLQRQLQTAFRRKNEEFGELRSLRAVGSVVPGTLTEFEATDAHGGHRLGAAELRSALTSSGVRSPHFRLEVNGNNYIIHGRGHGHGAGLCQWGARGQALAGRTALQIVQHYYPSARVVILAPPVGGG